MPVETKSESKRRAFNLAVTKTEGVEASGPRYLAMADLLRERISSGELKPGDRLPSFAEMRSLYGSTVATVERTYGVLEKEGLIERRQGSGTFVTVPQTIATGNIGFLGCAFPQRYRQAYYANLMEGVQGAVDEYDKHLLFLGTDRRWSREALAKVDGVLLGNIGGAEKIVAQFPPHLPCVSLLSAVDGVTSVIADDYSGMKQAIQHLLSLGHRRIACVMEKQPPAARLRLAAYNDTLIEAGITPDPSWICPVEDITYIPSHQRPSYMSWGYESMAAWIKNGWSNTGCTAVFAQNDTTAVGVLRALQEAGIRVPQDVSLMGFDGTEICDFSKPRLTSVEVPLIKIGAKAVELLLRQIETKDSDAHSVVLPTRIREGESTGSAPHN